VHVRLPVLRAGRQRKYGHRASGQYHVVRKERAGRTERPLVTD
jgi:hypothetical protein